MFHRGNYRFPRRAGSRQARRALALTLAKISRFSEYRCASISARTSARSAPRHFILEKLGDDSAFPL